MPSTKKKKTEKKRKEKISHSILGGKCTSGKGYLMDRVGIHKGSLLKMKNGKC